MKATVQLIDDTGLLVGEPVEAKLKKRGIFSRELVFKEAVYFPPPEKEATIVALRITCKGQTDVGRIDYPILMGPYTSALLDSVRL